MSGQSGAHQIVVGIIVATMASARRVTRKGRPNHPLEFKRRLAAVACDPAVSVARLALEHGVNANLLFKWRRQYQKEKFGTPDVAHAPAAAILSRFDVPTRSDVGATLLPVQVTHDASVATSPCLEVVFAGATVRISGSLDVAMLRTVLDTLARHS
jgi:transposase